MDSSRSGCYATKLASPGYRPSWTGDWQVLSWIVHTIEVGGIPEGWSLVIPGETSAGPIPFWTEHNRWGSTLTCQRLDDVLEGRQYIRLRDGTWTCLVKCITLSMTCWHTTSGWSVQTPNRPGTSCPSVARWTHKWVQGGKNIVTWLPHTADDTRPLNRCLRGICTTIHSACKNRFDPFCDSPPDPLMKAVRYKGDYYSR